MSFFNVGGLGGNPFSTPIGQKIEEATDETLASENWALNIEICDLVNCTPDGPKDAIKAIRKRLQQSNKNYSVVMYTLVVLETCVKNCGKAFHVQVSNKEFVTDLVKLIGPKNDPPVAVQDKVLFLIQSWADAFRNQPELSGVVQVYTDLKNKGIQFPMTDLDTMAPIYTPQRSVPDGGDMAPSSPKAQPYTASPSATQKVANIPVGLNPPQLAKIQSELDIVTANMSVLGEMLNELRPGHENPSDLQLLQELHATCRAMQSRIVELIGKLSNDEITAELLRINDELNNLFLRYSRFEKNRGNSAPSQVLGKALGLPTAAAIGGGPVLGTTPAATIESGQDSLIDLSEGAAGGVASLDTKFVDMNLGSATSQLSKLNTVEAQSGTKSAVDVGDGDEFDMFAQSRNTSYETTKNSGSTYKDNQNLESLSGGLQPALQARANPSAVAVPRETDFDEMAAWLDHTTEEESHLAEDSVTSSEFDRFLAERAAAADSLPNLPSHPATAGRQNEQSKTTRKEDDSLFAL